MALIILTAVVYALNVAIGVVLGQKYLRTGKIGYVWLAVVVVLWPFVSSLLHWEFGSELRGIVGHKFVWLYPFNLLAQGRTARGTLGEFIAVDWEIVGVGARLLVVVFLCRPGIASDLRVTESSGYAGRNTPDTPA